VAQVADIAPAAALKIHHAIAGFVTSGGTPLKGARFELKPLFGGRRRVTTSKATGAFEITSMEAGDYSITVSATGKTPVTEEVTIVTGTPLSKNFDLV
jgi:hypothetical protein